MQKKSKFNVFIFMMLIILGLTFQPAISTYAAFPVDTISLPDFPDDYNFPTGKLDEATTPRPRWHLHGLLSTARMVREMPIPTRRGRRGRSTGPSNLTVLPTPVLMCLADRAFNWHGNESFSIEFWVKTDGVVAPDENWVIIGRDDTATTGLHWWVGLNQY